VAHFDPRGPKWPTAIDVYSCAQRARVRHRTGRPTAAEMARELTSVLRNGAPSDRPSTRAKQRVLQISAPSECRPTAESGANEPRTTDAWRTKPAHEVHGATGSLPATIDAGSRGTGARVCWRRNPTPRHGYSVGYLRMRGNFRESLRPLSCFRNLPFQSPPPTSPIQHLDVTPLSHPPSDQRPRTILLLTTPCARK
jgi:hypothetical protein